MELLQANVGTISARTLSESRGCFNVEEFLEHKAPAAAAAWFEEFWNNAYS